MTEVFISAVANIFVPINFILMTIGVTMGILVGCLPVDGDYGTGNLSPFTFTMDAVPALMTLGGIYMGHVWWFYSGYFG